MDIFGWRCRGGVTAQLGLNRAAACVGRMLVGGVVSEIMNWGCHDGTQHAETPFDKMSFANWLEYKLILFKSFAMRAQTITCNWTSVT